jgi:murein DD-endopeptidase MepM/ murein hydrolase activator NlpD
MDNLSTGLLVLLALVAFNNYKSGTFGDWLRAKFLNQAAKNPAGQPVTPSTGGGGGGGHDLAMLPQAFNPAPGLFLAPVVGPVTSPFGQRPRDFHEGIDFGVPQGTTVHAARAGKVIAAGASGGYGLKVDLDHGQGVVTRYAHMSRIDVHVGDSVAAGGALGLSGSTGESTGPHVHFEIRINGKAVDPAPYLAGTGSLLAAGQALSGQQAVTA